MPRLYQRALQVLNGVEYLGMPGPVEGLVVRVRLAG